MKDHTLPPTLPAPKSLRSGAPMSFTAVTGESVVSPQQAMTRFEALRAWAFSVALAGLCAGAMGLAVWLGGDPFPQRLHLATLALTCAAATAHAIFNRDPKRYRRSLTLLMVYASLLADATGYFYWGVYSAFIGVVSVSGYGFASGTASRGSIIGCTMAVVGGHLGFGVAELAGWTHSHGLFVPQPWLGPGARLVVLLVLQLVTLGAVLGGLDAQKALQRVLGEYHETLRALAQRDAQLAEAREAEREARVGGEGRHTGMKLGRFQLGFVLGRGGMGEVYEAVDDAGDPCAVKVLARRLLDDAEALRRFHREARVVADLASPHIVRMIEVSPRDAPIPYLAMERLSGHDLGTLVKERPVRDLAEVVAMVRDVASGLDVAHRAGVAHRDLKPGNLFVTEIAGKRTWKILDFGVAKRFDESGTLTVDHLVGTPGYMAPEQARGEAAIDGRADVYSLGVVVYRLLTGRPVVVPSDMPSMLHEVVFRMPPQPSQMADVPAEVEAVLAIALAKSQADRFATAGELARALATAADGPDRSGEIVARARGILARTPWGHWLRRAHSERVREAVDA